MSVLVLRQTAFILSSDDTNFAIIQWHYCYISIAWLIAFNYMVANIQCSYFQHTITFTCLYTVLVLRLTVCILSSYDAIIAIIWWHTHFAIIWWHTHMMTSEWPCHPLMTYTFYIEKKKKNVIHWWHYWDLTFYIEKIYIYCHHMMALLEPFHSMSSKHSNWGTTFCDKLYDSNNAIHW